MSHVKTIALKGVSIYLTEIVPFTQSNDVSFLTEIEKKRYSFLTHPTKKSEFLASRWLKNEIFGSDEIIYDIFGSPKMAAKELQISISHSGNYVGIATSQNKIGFDIEIIKGKARKVSTKFRNERIENDWNGTSNCEMTALWSLKESMYKLSDRKELIFKTDLICYNKKDMKGRIKTKKGFEDVNLAYICFENHVLSIAQFELNEETN